LGEGLADGVVEVLAIHEGDGALDRRLIKHAEPSVHK
jgi:hypothetical protein